MQASPSWPLDDLTEPDSVAAIIDIDASALRNLLITQSYHDLAQAMAQHLEGIIYFHEGDDSGFTAERHA